MRDPAATSATVTLVDEFTQTRREIRWTLRGGSQDPALLAEFARERARQWLPLAAR